MPFCRVKVFIDWNCLRIHLLDIFSYSSRWHFKLHVSQLSFIIPPPQLTLPADVLISVNVTTIFLLTQARDVDSTSDSSFSLAPHVLPAANPVGSISVPHWQAAPPAPRGLRCSLFLDWTLNIVSEIPPWTPLSSWLPPVLYAHIQFPQSVFKLGAPHTRGPSLYGLRYFTPPS